MNNTKSASASDELCAIKRIDCGRKRYTIYNGRRQKNSQSPNVGDDIGI